MKSTLQAVAVGTEMRGKWQYFTTVVYRPNCLRKNNVFVWSKDRVIVSFSSKQKALQAAQNFVFINGGILAPNVRHNLPLTPSQLGILCQY